MDQNSESTLFHNERVQEAHRNYINGFSKKIIWGKWATLDPKMMYGHNSKDFS